MIKTFLSFLPLILWCTQLFYWILSFSDIVTYCLQAFLGDGGICVQEGDCDFSLLWWWNLCSGGRLSEIFFSCDGDGIYVQEWECLWLFSPVMVVESVFKNEIAIFLSCYVNAGFWSQAIARFRKSLKCFLFLNFLEKVVRLWYCFLSI